MNAWTLGFKRRFMGFPDETRSDQFVRFFPRLIAVILRVDYWIDQKRGTDFWSGTSKGLPVRTWNRVIDLVGEAPRGDVRVFVLGGDGKNGPFPDRPIPRLKKHAQLLILPVAR